MHARLNICRAYIHASAISYAAALLFPELCFSALRQAENLVGYLSQPFSHKLTHEPDAGNPAHGLEHSSGARTGRMARRGAHTCRHRSSI